MEKCEKKNIGNFHEINGILRSVPRILIYSDTNKAKFKEFLYDPVDL